MIDTENLQPPTLDTLRAELETARHEALSAKREALAARYGIPPEVAGLLRGDSPEQMEREAAALAAALAKGRPQNPNLGLSAGNAAGVGGPDLGWIRERFSGQHNPFGRGGVLWGPDEE